MEQESRALVTQIVDGMPFFKFLNPETREQMVPLAEVRRYDSGESVTREGEPDDTFFVIDSGQAGVFVMKLGNQEKVATLGDQDFFGEMALTSNSVRRATVTAESDMRVVAFPGEPLRALLQKDPNLHEFLVSVRMKREEDNRNRIADFELPDDMVAF